jgi:hypothetical protein
MVKLLKLLTDEAQVSIMKPWSVWSEVSSADPRRDWMRTGRVVMLLA